MKLFAFERKGAFSTTTLLLVAADSKEEAVTLAELPSAEENQTWWDVEDEPEEIVKGVVYTAIQGG